MDNDKKQVPDHFMRRWQRYADMLAKAADVPAALVMRVWPEQIEVLIASVSDGNPYAAGELADLGTGLYCETVMATRRLLSVPDALASAEWANNPDTERDMTSYLGLPLVWPDDTLFGTVCILDCRAHACSATSQFLLQQLRATIEADFRVICSLDEGPGEAVFAERFEAAARAMAAGR